MVSSPSLRPGQPELGVFSLPVLVAAFGYFVDIYDLVLIGMVGKASLLGIGIAPEAIGLTIGHLLGLQMIGMLIGGFLWGMVADKYGRVATLFGSIITYSIATALNGAVTELWQYEVLRVIAGIGLAGELGTGVTLVCESLPARIRAYGATVVACVGIAGAVAAFGVSHWVEWRTAFYLGGALGGALLVLRWVAHESALFARIDASVPKGSLKLLFGSRDRVLRYLRSIAIGLPTWYVVGLFVFMSLSTAKALQVTTPVDPRYAVLWCYIGLIVGDALAGVLSHWLASRRKVVTGFLVAGVLVVTVMLSLRGLTPEGYYFMCAVAGLSVGYWALFVTIAAEQFGTNLRATVATTVPNVARGLFDLMQRIVGWAATGAAVGGAAGAFQADTYLVAIAGIGVVCFGLAFAAVWTLEETHGKDLEYLEEIA